MSDMLKTGKKNKRNRKSKEKVQPQLQNSWDSI